MSTMATLNAINNLREEQRRKALQLRERIEALEAELIALVSGTGIQTEAVELHDRNISETQAADLRTRLKTFAQDWERPEADIYDQSAAR